MESRPPLVSLLMLGYNSVQYIKAAITSVKLQTYPYWELVFVDDGSTDGTWELAEKLAESDARIKVYRNPRNLGIVHNRQKALEYSVGDFIGHVDNDDILERRALEEMIRAFQEHPKEMLIYSDYGQINAEGDITGYVATKQYKVDDAATHGWRHFTVYRRRVHQHFGGYNLKLISACEDGDLMARVGEKFGALRLPRVLYYHRSHGKNAGLTNKKCETCEERPVCNFIRVWGKAVKYDHITYQPLTKEQLHGTDSIPSPTGPT